MVICVKKIKKFFYGLDVKTRKYMLLIGIVSMILQGISMINATGEKAVTKEDLKRPEYGMDNVQIPITVTDGNYSFDTVVELPARTYTYEEAQVFLQEAVGCLPEQILKSNSSILEVDSDLSLVKTIDGLPVDISWYTTNYEVVDSEGHVYNQEFDESRTEDITLFAVVSCGKYSMETVINIRVVSADLGEEQQMVAGINRAIHDAVSSSTGEYIELPEIYNGSRLRYSKVCEPSGYIFVLLGIVAILAVVLGDSKEKQKVLKKRQQQLSYDYSEVVSKITLLMGAGMTVRGAWERIVADYRTKNSFRIVYEQMNESLNQIKAGVPETEAYEQFGARCGLKEYQKLSALIVQNLKKGTKDLAALLELETIEAFEKRKNMAQIQGEEAGTKLLLPMVIMLVVVMIIIMVPAFVSFEM